MTLVSQGPEKIPFLHLTIDFSVRVNVIEFKFNPQILTGESFAAKSQELDVSERNRRKRKETPAMSKKTRSVKRGSELLSEEKKRLRNMGQQNESK
jgi:hypothetical protein